MVFGIKEFVKMGFVRKFQPCNDLGYGKKMCIRDRMNIARSSAERKSNRTHYYKEQGISEQAQKEIAAILKRERRSRLEEAR